MFKSKYFNLGMVMMIHAVNNTVAGNIQFAYDVCIAMEKYCNKELGQP